MEIVPQDRATNEMQRLAAKLGARELDEVIGESVVNSLRERFAQVDADRPNKLGGTRTHYMEECADLTSWALTPDGVLVSVTKEGIRTRILGTGVLPEGAIVPVNAQHLSIPAIAEAYGHGPSEFEDLVPLYRRKDGKVEAFALAEDVDEKPERDRKFRKTDETVLDWGSAENRIFFWLVDSVVQEADPSLVPTEDEIRTAAYSRLDEYFTDYRGDINIL